MEVVAIVLSILALAVAATGLLVSYKAYQRGGARIKVRTGYETSSTYAGGPLEWEVIAVHVTNNGLAGVQVTAVDLEVEGNEVPVPPDEGPDVDNYVLQGHHTERWALRVEVLHAAAGFVPDEGGTTRYRARVTLGNGARVYGQWHTYAVTAIP
jgi:hypothetical protein